MKSLTLIIVLLSSLALLTTEAYVIWRCPEFNLLKCRSVPKTCRSVRMIYIKHGHLECPGCLICVDPISYASFFPAKTNRENDLDSKRRRKMFRRRYKSKKRKMHRSKYALNQSELD